MSRGSLLEPYLLTLPALMMAAAILVWPVGELVVLALHDVNRFGQLRGFSGLENFTALAGDPDFPATILRTLVWTSGVVGGTLAIALPVALILNEDFYGCGLARVIVMLPWAVSLTMTAIVWRWALNGDAGLLNAALMALGLIHGPIAWLAEARTGFPIEILIGILASIPFTVTILLGGLSSIPDELYDAAAIEGAGSLQQFWFLTFPLLRPFINIALVVNTIYVVNSFPIIWTMTQGGPANATDVMVTSLFRLAFRWGRMGEASVVSLAMFVVLIASTLVYLRVAQGRRDEA